PRPGAAPGAGPSRRPGAGRRCQRRPRQAGRMGRARRRGAVGRARRAVAPRARALRLRAGVPRTLQPGQRLTRSLAPLRFGVEADFAIGVEEELSLVDPATHALVHTGVDVLERMEVPEA